ncbi:cupin domain-containing protein [Mesorhizobium sp. C264A]|uniref:cupin domain-containing protein n=1 Tax=Mesorhizobium sp. C264A TaxID=2956825 RepID=UPI003338DB41
MPTPRWPKASTVKLEDWGGGSNTLAGSPRASGRILSQNPNGSSECGLWSCTPGSRKITFAAEEFCHFLSGRGPMSARMAKRSRSRPACWCSSPPAGPAPPPSRKH